MLKSSIRENLTFNSPPFFTKRVEFIKLFTGHGAISPHKNPWTAYYANYNFSCFGDIYTSFCTLLLVFTRVISDFHIPFTSVSKKDNRENGDQAEMIGINVGYAKNSSFFLAPLNNLQNLSWKSFTLSLRWNFMEIILFCISIVN